VRTNFQSNVYIKQYEIYAWPITEQEVYAFFVFLSYMVTCQYQMYSKQWIKFYKICKWMTTK
jgi:hypothetical protein